jgi:hypothetical protein
MTATFHETDELRKWLADYLFTEIACNPNEVNMNLSLNDLGVGSRDAVVQRSDEFSHRAAVDCYEEGASRCP